MSILSVDNISPIGSGTSVTVNSAATLVLTNANITGVTTVGTGLDLNDNIKIRLGTGNDLSIYHDGSHSIIEDTGTGNLFLRSDSVVSIRGTTIALKNAANTETLLQCVENGAVDLYYNNSKKLETTSSGITLSDQLQVNGSVFASAGLKINADNQKLRLGASDDLELYHDGSDSFIKDTGTGALKVCSNLFRVNNAANTEAMIKAEENAGVTLSYDANTKFETTSSGVTVTGTCSATAFSGSSGTLTGVAFAAVRTAGNSNNTPFVFNSEEFDIGGDYNASNGIFTAPDIGYYQITVQMTSTSYSGNRHFYLDSSTNGGGSWTERANALTGTPGGANESINMFIGGIFKTTVTNQQFRVRTGYEFRGTSTYARFSAFKI